MSDILINLELKKHFVVSDTAPKRLDAPVYSTFTLSHKSVFGMTPLQKHWMT